MADAHLVWLRIAWVIMNRENNRLVEIPDEGREEIAEGLGLAVDFHERMMSLSVAAKERWAAMI